MIYSMTGYATTDIQLPSLNIQIDIKSVNHRFFDLTLRCPDGFKSLEPFIREMIINKIPRGKIDLRLNCKENQTTAIKINLNSSKLNNYLEIYNKIKDTNSELTHGSITDILRLPGIIDAETIELDEIKHIILNAIGKLAYELKANQEIEGEKLSILLLDKIDKIDKIVNLCLKILPEIIQNYKNKLQQKLLDAFEESVVNEQRFQQEFVYFCQKIDVDEELSRLLFHTNQLRSLINDGGIIGKKIDFLTQEMLREANTFGSKSVATTTTQYAIELKVLIEQIKEQLQNIA
ncbi:MAG: YicC/YloC family endoribonuclease [Neisseriaceae bacterium]